MFQDLCHSFGSPHFRRPIKENLREFAILTQHFSKNYQGVQQKIGDFVILTENFAEDSRREPAEQGRMLFWNPFVRDRI